MFVFANNTAALSLVILNALLQSIYIYFWIKQKKFGGFESLIYKQKKSEPSKSKYFTPPARIIRANMANALTTSIAATNAAVKRVGMENIAIKVLNWMPKSFNSSVPKHVALYLIWN